MKKTERKIAYKSAIKSIKGYKKMRQEIVPDGTHYELIWTGSTWFPTRKVNIDIINLDVNYIIIRADNYKEAYFLARELPAPKDKKTFDIRQHLSIVANAVL